MPGPEEVLRKSPLLPFRIVMNRRYEVAGLGVAQSLLCQPHDEDSSEDVAEAGPLERAGTPPVNPSNGGRGVRPLGPAPVPRNQMILCVCVTCETKRSRHIIYHELGKLQIFVLKEFHI